MMDGVVVVVVVVATNSINTHRPRSNIDLKCRSLLVPAAAAISIDSHRPYDSPI